MYLKIEPLEYVRKVNVNRLVLYNIFIKIQRLNSVKLRGWKHG